MKCFFFHRSFLELNSHREHLKRKSFYLYNIQSNQEDSLKMSAVVGPFRRIQNVRVGKWKSNSKIIVININLCQYLVSRVNMVLLELFMLCELIKMSSIIALFHNCTFPYPMKCHLVFSLCGPSFSNLIFSISFFI